MTGLVIITPTGEPASKTVISKITAARRAACCPLSAASCRLCQFVASVVVNTDCYSIVKKLPYCSLTKA